MSLQQLKSIVAIVVKRFTAGSMSLMSGAIAFFALLSLSPVLVIAVNVAGLVFGRRAARGEILQTLYDALGPEAAQVVVELLEQSNVDASSPWATILSASVTIYAATRVFIRLQEALNAAWGVRRKTPDKLKGKIAAVVRKRTISFLISLLVGLMLFASLAVKTVIAAFDALTGLELEQIPFLWRAIELGISLALMIAFIGAIYRVLPDVEVRWKDAFVGACLAAILITLGSSLISLYLGYFAATSISGAAGSVIILMLWIYLITNVVFIGAIVARVSAEHDGLEVRPEAHAEVVPDFDRGGPPAA